MALGVFVGCCLSWGLFFVGMPLGGFWLLLVLGFVFCTNALRCLSSLLVLGAVFL